MPVRAKMVRVVLTCGVAFGFAGRTIAATTPGSVIGWGEPRGGTVPAMETNDIALGAGESHSLSVRASGTAAAWGYNGSHQTDVPAGLVNVIAVSGGDSHSIALKADGRVIAWG